MSNKNNPTRRRRKISNFHDTEETNVENWWEMGPVFSTMDKKADTTTLAPGQPVGRFTLRAVVDTIWLIFVWAALFYLGLPRMLFDEVAPSTEELANTWWWITLIVIFVILMFISTIGVYDDTQREFTKTSLAFGHVFLAATAGFSIASLLHLFMVDHYLQTVSDWPAKDHPDPFVLPVLSMFSLIGFFIGLVLFPFAVRRAKKRQQLITHIRQAGKHYTGILKQITFCNEWLGGQPLFRVQVDYETPEGVQILQAAMTTSNHRVPLEGSPVKVLVDENGNTLIEPDPEHALTFDPNSDEYRQPSGDGGGGS
jgi:hypothetical protein